MAARFRSKSGWVLMILMTWLARAHASDLTPYRWIPTGTPERTRTVRGAPPQEAGPEAGRLPSPMIADPILVGGERIVRGAQYVQGARVRGSWSKSVILDSGRGANTLFSVGNLVRRIPEEVAENVKRVEEARELFERQAVALAPALSRASYVFPWRLEVDPESWEPLWIVEFIDESENGAYRAVFRMGAEGKAELVSQEKMSEGLSQGEGTAFPKGPRASTLSPVPLEGLVGDGTLSGAQFLVLTAVEPRAFAENLIFQYSLEDPRFDEVQAYFYVEQALKWFATQLATPLKTPITVKVNVTGSGPGGKSNAAFYFGKRIYLGAGDGVSYQGLVRDPSVVFHETTHALIDQVAGLPSQGEGGSLNEAFADFFSACILDNPNVGEASYLQGPYRRTLLNRLKANKDFSGSLYGDSVIVSGTLWDLRRSLGISKATSLALGTLARLGEGSKLSDFAPALLHAAGGLSADEQGIVRTVLSERNWKI